jgi:hypothetical protein
MSDNDGGAVNGAGGDGQVSRHGRVVGTAGGGVVGNIHGLVGADALPTLRGVGEDGLLAAGDAAALEQLLDVGVAELAEPAVVFGAAEGDAEVDAAARA